MNNNPNEINTAQKRDKLTEKAFMHSIAVSVICVVLCAVALCSATWAWFSGDVTSSENTIKTGYCNVTISVKDGDTAVDVKTGTTDTYTLLKDAEYVITISAEGTVSSSYCKLIIDGVEFYTDQVDTGSSISFALTYSDDTDVQIISRWGTYSGEIRDFVDGGEYLDSAVFSN